MNKTGYYFAFITLLRHGGFMKVFDRLFLFGVYTFFFIGIISFGAYAKPADCTQIIEQLQQMKAAQASVQETLISNHELMAQSLESYSEALLDSAGRAHKTISENMNSAAALLRQRAIKAQNISKKLETHTEDLIKSVDKCIK